MSQSTLYYKTGLVLDDFAQYKVREHLDCKLNYMFGVLG